MLSLLSGAAGSGEGLEDFELNLDGIDDKEIDMVHHQILSPQAMYTVTLPSTCVLGKDLPIL